MSAIYVTEDRKEYIRICFYYNILHDTHTNCRCHVEHKASVTRRIISMYYGSRVINPRIMIMRTFGGFIYSYIYFLLCFICFTFYDEQFDVILGSPVRRGLSSQVLGKWGSVILSEITFFKTLLSLTQADPIVRGFYLLRLTASCFDSNIFLRQKHTRRLRITNTVWVSK